MKRNTILLAALLFLSMSCNKVDQQLDINADPNAPGNVPIQVMFPNIMITQVDNYTGSLVRFSSNLTQQIEGVARAWSNINQYTGLTSNRIDGMWKNYYEGTLNEIQIAKDLVTENEWHHHLAILKTLEAFVLMNLTDFFDEIPYSEAFKGVDNFNPAYDKQSAIYQVIFDNLKEAITLIDGSPGKYAPSSEDVLYNGDMDLWKKAAYGFMARAHLHLAEYDKALEAANNAYEHSSENLGFQYPGTNQGEAYWYRFNRDRTGDFEFHPTMGNIMENLNDTVRLKLYDQPFRTNHPFFVADQYVEMLTYRELELIKAECLFRLNMDQESMYASYLNGVRAGFTILNIEPAVSDNYLSQNAVAPGAQFLTLNNIITQKYLALFMEPEVYSDFRRTDTPALSPVAGNTIPVRLPYSSDEHDFNENAPEPVNIFTDKVGWDN